MVVSPLWCRSPSSVFRRCPCLCWEHLLQLLWMSLPFDQQATLTSKPSDPTLWMEGCLAFWSASDTDSKNLSSNFRCGGVSAVVQISFFSFQEVSSPWQRTSSATFVDVSTFWSASDTDSKNLSSNFFDGLVSLLFDQQVTLSPKNLCPNCGWGLSPSRWRTPSAALMVTLQKGSLYLSDAFACQGEKKLFVSLWQVFAMPAA